MHLDADGARDAGEPGVAGYRVFLDDNGDGALDPAETSVLTGPDGRYTFEGLNSTQSYAVTQQMALEWGPQGIRVNIVSAGVVDTDALKHFPGAFQKREPERGGA